MRKRERRKIKLSTVGKISAAIIIMYVIIAVIVPYLNLPNPLYYRAPPQDIFAPKILDNITLKERILRANAANNMLYIITSQYKFEAFDLSYKKLIYTTNLTAQNYSSLYQLHYSTYTSIIFHSSDAVYFYDTEASLLREYEMKVDRLFLVEQPFSYFAGFAVYNGSALNVYSVYPFERLEWSILLNESPIGMHTDFTSIYLSFPDKLVKIYYDGAKMWERGGNFTSNPTFLSSYEGNFVYVAEGMQIDRINITDGKITERFNFKQNIIHLEFYGQSLYAISSQHTFGKINLIGGGYSWILSGIKKYFMDPFIDGLTVVFSSGKIGFVLLSTGEIQWGYELPADGILINKIGYTDRNVIAYIGNKVLIFSATGELKTPLPPSKKYLLGTDNAGRDVLSQLFWSFRSELYIAFVSMLVVIFVGTFIGIIAGYFSGPVDDILRFITDSFLLIPAIGYAALMLFVLGITQHINATLLASLFAVWPIEARAVRNYTKVVKEKPFIEAAKVSGAGHLRIMFIHIFPEISVISIVYGLSGAAMALLLEVGISFLGFGNYMVLTWGWMIANAYFVGIWDRWWIILPPLLTLMLLVISLYLLSKDIQDKSLPEEATML